MMKDILTRYKCDLHSAGFEFIGTTLFLLFLYNGCQTAATIQQNSISGSSNAPSVDQIAYCANSAGLSLFVTISVFFRVTGGVFNPAVSFALLLTRGLSFVRFVLYFVAQIVGSIVAAYLLQALHPGSTSVNTILNPSVSYARGVFIEAFTTFLLVITILVTATDKRTVGSKILAPLTIAAALWVDHLWAIYYTGASMNPARSFGPSVAEGFNSDQWVYWVGPLVGSTIAVVIFKYLHYTEYWTFGNCWDHSGDHPHVDDGKGKKSILPLFETNKHPSSPGTAIFNEVLPTLDHSEHRSDDHQGSTDAKNTNHLV